MAMALVASSLVLARMAFRCDAFVAAGLGGTLPCVVWMLSEQFNDGCKLAACEYGLPTVGAVPHCFFGAARMVSSSLPCSCFRMPLHQPNSVWCLVTRYRSTRQHAPRVASEANMNPQQRSPILPASTPAMHRQMLWNRPLPLGKINPTFESNGMLSPLRLPTIWIQVLVTPFPHSRLVYFVYKTGLTGKDSPRTPSQNRLQTAGRCHMIPQKPGRCCSCLSLHIGKQAPLEMSDHNPLVAYQLTRAALWCGLRQDSRSREKVNDTSGDALCLPLA